jgi:C-methyltransferase
MESMKNELKQLFTAYWEYIAISTACKLNVFDEITESGITANILSQNLYLQKQSLQNLLNVLVEKKFLSKNAEKYYLTVKSQYLTENHPESLKYACLNWSDEHLTAWQNMSYTIKTGKSAFKKVYGDNFFNYLNKNPEKLRKYHKAMFEYARDDYANISNKIDFGTHKSILDAGGGYGALIRNIKENYPEIICILFDLPAVIDEVELTDIVKISGDFFNEIPVISDAIILSRVIHDWDDAKASVILNNCFKALPKSGSLYIIENCTDKYESDLPLLSLNMQIMCDSNERSSVQYINLAKETGFTFDSEVQLNDLQTILIFKKL